MNLLELLFVREQSYCVVAAAASHLGSLSKGPNASRKLGIGRLASCCLINWTTPIPVEITILPSG